MITDEPDWRFKQRLDMLEMAWPRLLADPHYGPLMHSTGRVHLLDEFRQEWREREERARARRLRWEASVGEG